MSVSEINMESEQAGDKKGTPWGLWATLGFSCLIGFVYVIASVFVLVGFIVFAVAEKPEANIPDLIKDLESSSFFLMIVICIGSPLVIGLSILFAKIRKGITVSEYLCFRKVGGKEIFRWSLITLLFLVCSDGLSYLIGRPIVPEFMVHTYTTSQFKALVWFALLVAAPLGEEIFFRGFLFAGFEKSRLGPVGAVIITSLAWSSLHTQYSIYGVVSIFAGGLLLGFARLKSKSVYLPIGMHAIWNLVATIEVVIYLKLAAGVS